MTTTLATVLRAEAVAVDPFKDSWEACGGALKVRFMRNDFLDTRTLPRYKTLQCERGVRGGTPVDNTRCRIFATDETLAEFDTLVVNSGAHPRPAPEFGRQMDAAAETLTESMNRLHGKGKAVLVVRNTTPGHWGCTERWVRGVREAGGSDAGARWRTLGGGETVFFRCRGGGQNLPFVLAWSISTDPRRLTVSASHESSLNQF